MASSSVLPTLGTSVVWMEEQRAARTNEAHRLRMWEARRCCWRLAEAGKSRAMSLHRVRTARGRGECTRRRSQMGAGCGGERPELPCFREVDGVLRSRQWRRRSSRVHAIESKDTSIRDERDEHRQLSSTADTCGSIR